MVTGRVLERGNVDRWFTFFTGLHLFLEGCYLTIELNWLCVVFVWNCLGMAIIWGAAIFCAFALAAWIFVLGLAIGREGPNGPQTKSAHNERKWIHSTWFSAGNGAARVFSRCWSISDRKKRKMVTRTVSAGVQKVMVGAKHRLSKLTGPYLN